MASGRKSRLRGLDEIELALMKRMKLNDLPRDYIMSFFVRPGRKISSAVTSEVLKQCPDISPATDEDVKAFINRRLREASSPGDYHGFGPTSAIRVQEILELTQDGQTALPGFESHFAEFKSELPKDKEGKAKIARSMAAFANNDGGYVFFGIADGGKILGIPEAANIERFWNDISDVVTRHFTPFFPWERNIVPVNGKNVAVAYVFSADKKPIIASSSFTDHLKEGHIYFRYNRSSECIHAGDLINILRERDRIVAAQAADSARRDDP
jgi:hypothetical protein